jgi:hypothetical protein
MKINIASHYRRLSALIYLLMFGLAGSGNAARSAGLTDLDAWLQAKLVQIRETTSAPLY